MKNNGYVYQNQITSAEAGISVLDFYARNYPRFSREQWALKIHSGQIFRNGKAAAEDESLESGDVLEYRRPPWVEPAVPKKFDILFEDTHLLIVNKPAGLPVLPGDMYLENTLLTLVRQKISPGLSPVHRLDRPTSGAVIFAKTPESAKQTSLTMKQGKIRKTYLALVEGENIPDSFSVTIPIGQHPHPVLKTVAAASADGRLSETCFRTVKRCTGRTLLMAFLKTGRPHQIRIHLACAGCPLAGEEFYGTGGIPQPNATHPGAGNFLLHAWRLRLPHPETGIPLKITAPLPREILL
ncbi:MAG: RluA family pseudouridine synthase [Acidobacteria bacterium]|nr:RluA family pseudouridine synthase [Acidobacteriota bacterium]